MRKHTRSYSNPSQGYEYSAAQIHFQETPLQQKKKTVVAGEGQIYEPSACSLSGNSFSRARSMMSAKLSSFDPARVAFSASAVTDPGRERACGAAETRRRRRRKRADIGEEEEYVCEGADITRRWPWMLLAKLAWGCVWVIWREGNENWRRWSPRAHGLWYMFVFLK